VVAAGSVLLSTTGACGSTTIVDRCVNYDMRFSMVGAGLRLLSAGSPTVSHSPSSPWSTGSEGGISCKHSEFSCQHIHHYKDKYLTTLLEEFTSWDVVSVTFNFLATCLRSTLRGLLSGTGRLASQLVRGTWMRGTLGSPGRLNLDRSWNCS
jgi:hypothetical protein